MVLGGEISTVFISERRGIETGLWVYGGELMGKGGGLWVHVVKSQRLYYQCAADYVLES